MDLSQKQLDNAKACLENNGYAARLVCAPMESDLGLPPDCFDYVYSICGIGWTTDLPGTLRQLASCLKRDGILIFRWHHTLNYCVAWSCAEWREVVENDQLVFSRSYFDESYFTMPVDGSEVILCNRKVSAYINALAEAGGVVERMIEQTDRQTMESSDGSDKMKKARMLPLSMCFRARKL